MRALAGLALSLLVLVVAASSPAATASSTSLRIVYWEDRTKSLVPTSIWTLRCDPPGGTLQRPARACARLEAGGSRLFAPFPKNIVCTEIYGGPQLARIVGTLNGRRVWATFSRKNGCAIDRWQRLSPWLLPPGGIT